MIKQLSVPEILAKALFLYRKRVKKGKTSRRITIFLPPNLLPPEDGGYETALGVVTIKSIFKSAEGRWVCVIKLPPQEGFQLKDYPSPEELRELSEIVDRLWAK